MPNFTWAAGNHCTKKEQLIFSCQIENSSKVASLCASKNLTKNKGYLVYRFGAANNIELQFPAKLQNSLQAFRYAHYFRYQVNRTEISFLTKNSRYAIFDYYDGEQTPQYLRGLSVNQAENETQLLCGKNVISNLPKLENIIPCDADSALANCH